MRIFKGNPRARFYTTVYVDAFAGTGRIDTSGNADVTSFEETRHLKGSAQIALEVQPEFDQYLFIERSKKRCAELEKLKANYPSQANRIHIENAEANAYLKQWCDTTDWSRTRAVLFLDPFGMQVEWELLKSIADTHAIDVWLLFPIGMGVNRVLTRNQPPPENWANRLTKTFGTTEWRSQFYPETLFPGYESKNTDFARISSYFVKRLALIFTGVASNPLLLKTPKKNVPLFLLCFATGSNKPSAKDAALRIAENILGKR